ncbi:LLM class flavin-dependent oxidoreductase [Cohnella abietis]|uniref:Nitrilotriacetate monooxygenase n=1 Tax=Cohnella abietis TaxID=2507935 RepID=A0A3T1CZ48_9BACL|nr:LLM class flavin-dependent oxidoreductase [Cohnella abietis]BBI31137.1 nitrilotriacetate monooxygenase [Cohnella abietis]
MTNGIKQMHIGVRFQQSPAKPDAFRILQELAEEAESSKLDFVTFAGPTESLGLVSALSVSTRHIGLTATIPIGFHEPYNIARKLASLDHISKGRVAWKWDIVPSEVYAANFAHIPVRSTAETYERAAELLNVVKGLWDAWEEDAIKNDKVSGVYANGLQIHELHHKGAWFKVKGAINLPRPPQGNPVLIHTASDAEDVAFAAGHAEVVLQGNLSLNDAIEQYKRIKTLAEQSGRKAKDVIVLQQVQVSAEEQGLTSSLQQWFQAGACDGFVLQLEDDQRQIRQIREQVIPALQRSGLFRLEYTGSTLREHLGLSRPIIAVKQ